MLDSLLAAGGNSRAARAARARLQLRDRFGRWIEMGRGLKFKVRLRSGAVVSAQGKYVGNTDAPDVGQVRVTNDPNGLPDGFYQITSNNAQEVLASLDPAYLEERGISIGKGADGTTIGERADRDIPNQDDIVITDAPLGWKVDEQNPNAYVTDDGDYRIAPTTDDPDTALAVEAQNGDGSYTPQGEPVADLPSALDKVDTLDAQGVTGNETAPAPTAEVETPARDLSSPRTMIDYVRENNGLTLDLATGDVADSGYIVAEEGHALQIDAKTFFGDEDATVAQIAKYISDNKELLSQGGKRLGFWYDNDPERGVDLVELDITDQIEDKDEAIRLGQERNQIAIWDVQGSQTIDTGGNGGREQEESGDTDPGTVEPIGDDGGADSRVDSPDGPEVPGGEPASDEPEPELDALGKPFPTDRAGLEQRLAQVGRLAARPDGPNFDNAVEAERQIEERLARLDETPAPAEEPAPAPEPVEAPETPSAPVSVGDTPDTDVERDPTDREMLTPEEEQELLQGNPPVDQKSLLDDIFAGEDDDDHPEYDDSNANQQYLQDILNLDEAGAQRRLDVSLREEAKNQAILDDPETSDEDRAKAEADLFSASTLRSLYEQIIAERRLQAQGVDTVSPQTAEPTPEPTVDATPEVATPDAVPSEDPEALQRRIARLENRLSNTEDPSSDKYAQLENELNEVNARLEAIEQARTPAPEPVDAPETPEEPVDAPEPAPELPEPVEAPDERDPVTAMVEDTLGYQDSDIENALRNLEDAPSAPETPVEVEEPVALSEREARAAELDANFQKQIEETGFPIPGRAPSHIFDRIIEGKDLSPEQREDLEDRFSNGDSSSAVREALSLPNAANTGTRRRTDVPEPVTLDVKATQLRVSEVPDPNLIMDDIKRNHPDHRVLDNGDIVVTSREAMGKRYDVVVRRLRREHFMTYVRETDLETGTVTVSKVGNETHSYTALNSKMNRAKSAIGVTPKDLAKDTKPGKWMQGQKNRQVLDRQTGDVFIDPVDDYIDNTDIPRSSNQARNDAIAAVADVVGRGDASDAALNVMARRAAIGNGLSPELAEAIIESVSRRKVLDSQNAIREAAGGARGDATHISYDGKVIQPGDTVEWTDWRTTSPTYGQVFRGRIASIQDIDNGHRNQKDSYAYNDHVYVILPEYNRLRGAAKPNSQQRDLVTSNLRVVDSEDSPLGEPFFAKQEELEARGDRVPLGTDRASDLFDVPEGRTGATTPRPRKPKPAQEIAPTIDNNGQQSVSYNGTDYTVDSRDSILSKVADSEGISVPTSDIKPGDIVKGRGRNAWAQVIEVSSNDKGTTLTLANPNAQGVVTVTERLIPKRDPKLVVFRSESQDAPAPAPADVPTPAALAARQNVVESLLDTRQVTPREASSIREDIASSDLSAEDAKDIADDLLSNRKPKSPSIKETDEAALVADIREVAQETAKTPGAEYSAMQLAEVASKHEASVSHNYDGYAVQMLTLDNLGSSVLNDPNTEDMGRVSAGQLEVGDIVSTLSIRGKRFAQVVDVDEDEYQVTLKEVSDTPEGGRAVRYSMAMSDLEAYRPSEEATVNDVPYFDPSGDRSPRLPAGYSRNRLYRTVIDPKGRETLADKNITMDKPEGIESNEVLDRIYAEGQKLVDNYSNGFTAVGLNNAGDGIDNIRAQPLKFDDGTIGFVKILDNRYQYDNEILSNRIAVALGISNIEMVGLGDGQTLLTKAILGTDASMNMTALEEAIDSGDAVAYPNAYRIGLLDYLIRNPDRHSGNMRVSEADGDIYPIDHGRVGISWPADVEESQMDRSGLVYAALGARFDGDWTPTDVKFSSAELLRMRNALNSLRSEFDARGKGDWLDATLARMDIVINSANIGEEN